MILSGIGWIFNIICIGFGLIFCIEFVYVCLITIFLYVCWEYFVMHTTPVQLIYSPRNPLNFKIIQKLQSYRYYYPVILGKSAFLQVIFLLRWKKVEEPRFVQETLKTADSNNEILLDWCFRSDDFDTIIFLCGLTGTSNESYARSFCHYHSDRYNVVVVNRPGVGLRSNLTDPHIRFMGNEKTLRRIILHVKSRISPDKKLFACGFSLGGHNLMYYLTRDQYCDDPIIDGAMLVCNPYDISSNTYRMMKLHPFYAKVLTGGLIRFVKSNEKLFRDYEKSSEGIERSFSYDNVMKARSIPEFDEAFTIKVRNFSSFEQYYQTYTVKTEDLMKISIPCLALHSKDDPVCIIEAVPFEMGQENPNFLFAITEHGSHCCYAQSNWFGFAKKETFMETIAKEYFNVLTEQL